MSVAGQKTTGNHGRFKKSKKKDEQSDPPTVPSPPKKMFLKKVLPLAIRIY